MSFDRLIPFDRVLNFRDFGGWETEDGAKVTRGKLFRSASFHDASDADIEKLNTMGLRFLVDLRRPEERKHEPTRWESETCRIIFNDEGAGGHALPPHLQALMQSDLTPQLTYDYMMSLYREIPFDPRLVSLYSDWFAELRDGGSGVVHCAAGKDRTGIACALTLFALDVPEEAVFADYEFTNQAVDLEKRMPRIQERMEARLGRKLQSEALRPMLGVHVDYLRASLEVIQARHGTVFDYMERELGVGERERVALRESLIA
jgi:protein-tyrosine phosphatase